jgi:hypothetical protein
MADAALDRIFREFVTVNDSIAQENTIRKLILHASNRDMGDLSLTIQDAKIEGLRARATRLRNAIMEMGDPDPGAVNAHIEDQIEEEEVHVEEHLSKRDQFKKDNVCVHCGVDTDQQCSACKQVRYCGADCWRKDREIHKLECKKI